MTATRSCSAAGRSSGTYLADPSGAVLALLKILARGEHDVDRLPAALGASGHVATNDDISRIVRQVDEWGVLERADSIDGLDADTRQRHASNLRYYDLFSTRSRRSADMHLAAADSTVLLLSAGGLGSGILNPWWALASDGSPWSIQTLSRSRISPGSSSTPPMTSACRR